MQWFNNTNVWLYRTHLQNSLSLSHCELTVLQSLIQLAYVANRTALLAAMRRVIFFNDDAWRALCPCSQMILTSLHVNDDFPLNAAPQVEPGQRAGLHMPQQRPFHRPGCDEHMIRETNGIRANHLPPTAIIRTAHNNNTSVLIGRKI